MKINLIYKRPALVYNCCPRGSCAAAAGQTLPSTLSLGVNCRHEFHESDKKQSTYSGWQLSLPGIFILF